MIFRSFRDNLHRYIRRTFLLDPHKTPQRFAVVLASTLLLSIIITYNVLFEKKTENADIKPVSVTDLYREHNAKKRLEHIELQRNILKARYNSEQKPHNEV